MQKRTLYLFTLLELIWFGALFLSSKFGTLYLDEAWYLTASRQVMQGQVLYRDFAFTQGPVLPYVYGAFLSVLGTNLTMGRFVSVALAALALALLLHLTYRLAGRPAAVLAWVLLLATPGVVYYLALVKTYSLVAVLMLLALAMLLHGRAAPTRTWVFLSTVVAGMTVLTRVSFLPLLGLVFLFWVWRGRGRASGAGLLIVGVVTLAVIASSNGNFFFDVFEFHMKYGGNQGINLDALSDWGSMAVVSFAPAIACAVLLPVLWCVVPEFRTRLADWWSTKTDAKFLFLLVAIGLVAAHFASPGRAWEYQIPGYLLVAILLAAVASTFVDVRAQPILTFLLAASVVVSSAAIWSNVFPGLWEPSSALLTASQASEVLAQRGRPNDTLLGGFNHLALASGLHVYPGNEMGMFSVADGLSSAETTQRHFLSQQDVTAALVNCSASFIATDPVALFPMVIPSLEKIPDGIQEQWRELLLEKYYVIYTGERVAIFERSSEKCAIGKPP